MNILILGGTHLMGPWIINSLLDRGHSLTMFNRGQTITYLPPEVNRIYGDRRHLLNYKNELQKIEPEVVIDMIAMTESDAKQLIAIFQSVAKRLVVISSGDVYMAHEKLCQPHSNTLEPLPLYENSALRQQAFPYRHYATNKEEVYHLYDKSKVEKIIAAAPIHSTILRLPFVYGPGDHSRLLPYLNSMADNSPDIFLEKSKATWRCTRGYVEDMAEGIVAAVTDEREGKFIYNVGEMNALTEKQWVEKIANLMDWQGELIEKASHALPDNLREPFNWNQDIIYDTSKIRHDLHYKEAYSPEQALAKSIEWALNSNSIR